MPQSFAVHNLQIVLRGGQELLLPEPQRRFQCIDVYFRQHVLEGALARTTNPPGLAVGSKSQLVQLSLPAGGGTVGQILRAAPHAAEHRKTMSARNLASGYANDSLCRNSGTCARKVAMKFHSAAALAVQRCTARAAIGDQAGGSCGARRCRQAWGQGLCTRICLGRSCLR